jgi:EAL domain-containing protein (putative c-di-GMP-specific phosphodiesterase class I)
MIATGSARPRPSADDVAKAITAGEIVPWYQPIVDLSTAHVVGVEALARWAQPSVGVEPAAAFVAVVENSDLVVDLDRTIMRQALADLGRWQVVRPDLRLSLNVSGRQLDRDDWLPALQEATGTAGVSPDRVILELTETVRPLRRDVGADLLQQARAVGFEIWLDDFGTGWASLYDLVNLPATGLKIDQCFAQDLGMPAVDAVVRAMAGAAAELGLDVIIEGIGADEQARYAHGLGCGYAQGFLWSPAVPAAELPALLATWPARGRELR